MKTRVNSRWILLAQLTFAWVNFCEPFAAQAQTVAPGAAAQPAEVVIGKAIVKPREGLEVVYTLFASNPRDSKLTGQKIRLQVEESGSRDVTGEDGQVSRRQGNSSHGISINTGKYKTVAQLCGIVDGMFRRFLSGAKANQDLGKIGDAKYGGELHFVAESPDRLRFDYIPSETRPENAIRFSRADVEAFAGLLAK